MLLAVHPEGHGMSGVQLQYFLICESGKPWQAPLVVVGRLVDVLKKRDAASGSHVIQGPFPRE